MAIMNIMIEIINSSVICKNISKHEELFFSPPRLFSILRQGFWRFHVECVNASPVKNKLKQSDAENVSSVNE